MDSFSAFWFRLALFGDFVDRLHHRYTPGLIMLLATVTTGRYYFSTAIQCVPLGNCPLFYASYADAKCLAQTTYFVPLRQRIPNTTAYREEGKITYYLWVSVILTLQAAAFHIPKWMTINLYRSFGLELERVMTAAASLGGMKGEGKKTEADAQAAYLEGKMRIGSVGTGHGVGFYMPILYLLAKLLYLANIVIQFFALNRLLGKGYWFWVIETLIDLFSGHEWEDSGVFPFETKCSFQIPEFRNVQTYTAQCVLTMNHYNEKIFFGISIWLLLVAALTAFSFCKSVTVVLAHSLLLVKPAKTMLTDWAVKKDFDEDKRDLCQQDIEEFCDRELRLGGFVLLRMVGNYAGSETEELLLREMFFRFQKREAAKAGIENVYTLHTQTLNHSASNSQSPSLSLSVSVLTLV